MKTSKTLRLTDTILRRLRPAGKRFELRDEASGLVARVGVKGDIKWVFDYQAPNGGKRRKFTLEHPYRNKNGVIVLGLAAARRQADEYTMLLRRGIDPQTPEDLVPGRPASFQEAIERWIKDVAVRENRTHDMQRRWLSYLPEEILQLELPAVTRGHGKAVQRDAAMQRGKASANNILATASSVLSWCDDFDWIEKNPWRSIPRFRIPPRKRYLSHQEIRIIWAACEKIGSDACRAVQVLLLTGQRMGEILAARKEEVNGDWLHIPGDRTKSGNAHDVFLAPLTHSILFDGGDETYFFPSPVVPDQPLGDIRSGVATIRRWTPDLEHWQVKDLRNTFTSQAARAGCPKLHISMCLNHSLPGMVDSILDMGSKVTEDHYLERSVYRNGMQEVWETWEQRVKGIVETGGGRLLEMTG